jgi:tryptophan-rich sensory protein
MATTHGLHRPSTLPWNRNDSTGFWLSVMLPLVAVLIGNAIIFATGSGSDEPAYDQVPWAPPGWVIGLIWLVIYPMWGAARWYARQTGLAGVRTSRWVLTLIAWGLVYPIVTSTPNLPVSVLANAASLLLAIVTAWQVRRVSKRAFWLIAPSTLWLGFANALGWAALSAAV